MPSPSRLTFLSATGQTHVSKDNGMLHLAAWASENCDSFVDCAVELLHPGHLLSLCV